MKIKQATPATNIIQSTNENSCNAPIGIFDSGLGGLTIARAIASALPQENLVYFGDTANAPWGDKPAATIQQYARKICDVLLNQHHCKIIVVACNTATSVALEAIHAQLDGKVEVINVIDPVVTHLADTGATGAIGLIGTKQTVKAAKYSHKIALANPQLNVKTLATPLLVPLIEEGFVDAPATRLILGEYLNSAPLQNINALVLGCTHYPLLRDLINEHYQHKIPVIDASIPTAAMVAARLQELQLLNDAKISAEADGGPVRKFFISDYTEAFAATAKQFFGDAGITLEELTL
jgi:glutamate racemase